MEVLSADQLEAIHLTSLLQATQRATDIPAVRRALDAYVTRRRAEIGGGEPEEPPRLH